MNLLGQYLRQQKKYLILAAVCAVVFSSVILLYGLPLQAVIYPVLLCMLLAFLFLVLDFLHTGKKHERLERMKTKKASMMDSLPEAQGIEEQDYLDIIGALKDEIAELETTDSRRYQAMIDYYTIWVHQIKTPIASMRLNLPDEDTAMARKLSFDLFRIEQYVEMVLVFLRLDANSTDYVFASYPLDLMIRQSVKKFATEFITRKIRLEYEGIDKTVVTDEKWLSFVLEQLLSNALKYTRSGSIKIYMEHADTLCIADTGIGIAPEDLPRIFENGYTGYNGRSDKKASGIGLYLCKRICDNLGLSITVTSKVAEGTIVRIAGLNESNIILT